MPTSQGFSVASAEQLGGTPPKFPVTEHIVVTDPRFQMSHLDAARPTLDLRRVPGRTSLRSNSSNRTTSTDSTTRVSPGTVRPRRRFPDPPQVRQEESLPLADSQTWSEGRSGLVSAPLAMSTGQIDRLSMAFAQSELVQTSVRSNKRPTGQVLEHRSLPLPPLFKTLCITDRNISGNPIKLHSRNFGVGPRGLQVGTCMFLNLPFGGSESCMLSVEVGRDGRPGFLLEIAGPLLDQSHGRTAFLMAAQIDVTELVRKVAVTEYSMGRRNAVGAACDVAPTVGSAAAQDDWSDDDTDYWIELAQSDGDGEDGSVSSGSTTSWTTNLSNSAFPHSKSSVNVSSFLNLIQKIRSLHTHYFVLAPMSSSSSSSSSSSTGRSRPLSGDFYSDSLIALYTITHVSPSIWDTPQDLYHNLSHTSPEVLGQLGWDLAAGEVVKRRVRWGKEGVLRWLWCSPVEDGRTGEGASTWWVCFLVEEEVGGWGSGER